MVKLVRTLKTGPLDVIGDIHGEYEALHSLLENLGYTINGDHPNGRHLVFVGDLCDRGPNSPSVIRRVQNLVEAGAATALIGNHELNLLRREEVHGDDWFYGVDTDPEFGTCETVSDAEQTPILEFLRTLPIAVERDDLRVVHAAWTDEAIDACRDYSDPIDIVYDQFEQAARQNPEFLELEAKSKAEHIRLEDLLRDRTTPTYSKDIGCFEAYSQIVNPIRVITSGIELLTERPFFAAGRWRFTKRIAWWKQYFAQTPVLFGHYWRWSSPDAYAKFPNNGGYLFADDPPSPRMSQSDRAYCIDFSVGSRFKQRRSEQSSPFYGRLAAMKWPERNLVFDTTGPRRDQDVDTPYSQVPR